MKMFYVSLIAVCTGLLLCGLLLVVKDRPPTEPGEARPDKDESRTESEEKREKTANLR